MKAKKLMDIEVYRNYFLVGIKDFDTKEIINYEISPFKDDRLEVYNFFTTYTGFLITFNGISYDNMVINYFIKDYKVLSQLSQEDLNDALKEFSDDLIKDRNSDSTKKYKNYNPIWIDIDLFLYWSMGLRKSKQLSLKALGIQLNHEEVQELPYHPNIILEYDEMVELEMYNNKNDLGILEKLFEKQIEEVRLRRFIKQEYGFACWSSDAPKIVSQLLLKEYSKVTGTSEQDIKKLWFKEYKGTIGDLLKGIKFEYKHPVLQKIYEKLLNEKRDFNKTFVLTDKNANLKVSMGIGGIHTLIENKMFKSTDAKVIYSSDVQSLYPALIINYGICRFSEVLKKYKEIRKERIIAKKEKQKQKDTLLKLVLNSYSGLIDNQYSWLYYPEGALKLRILGQLIELKAMDECIANNIQVIALNTDSIDVLIDKSRVEEYIRIIDKVGEEYNLIFEHEQIQWTNYININNYIQRGESKIKRKGQFRYGEDIPLGDSTNEQIIPKVLELYFDKGIPVKESISNPEKYGFHIYDYCVSKKIKRGDYQVYYNGQVIQNLNRYYFSKNSPYLFKKKKEKSTFEHVHVKEGVKLFNSYKELSFKEYDINYQYYIKKVNAIIYGLEYSQIQTNLF